MPRITERVKPAFCPFCGSKLADYQDDKHKLLDVCANCEIEFRELELLTTNQRFSFTFVTMNLRYCILPEWKMEIVAKNKNNVKQVG